MNSNLLKSIRIRQGYKQKDIYEKLNITKHTYSRKELGKENFKLTEIKFIKDFLNLTDSETVEIFLS